MTLSTYSDAHSDSNILIDIDGLTVYFALMHPDTGLDTSSIIEYKTNNFPTATDCVQHFEKETGIKIAGKKCAISVSGPILGDSIRIARCPWIISARGFGYLFQNEVLLLNDSAAKLWAASDNRISTHKPLGSFGRPDFQKRGRWLGINFDTGLGAAILAGQGGGRFIHIATEAGHMAFAPINEEERMAAAALMIGSKPVSWERTLFDDEGNILKNAAMANRTATTQLQMAERLGSFVGDLILGTGSWDGVLLFGRAGALLSNANHLAAYKARVESRAHYQFQLRAVPQWTFQISNINLVGAAQYLTAQSA